MPRLHVDPAKDRRFSRWQSPSLTRALKKIGDSRNGNVFAAGKFISLGHNCRTLDTDRMHAVNLRAVRIICYHAAPTGINAGHECRAVYLCSARITRMVITKSGSFAGKLPKRRGSFLADEIRAHSVPHHNHNVPVRFSRLSPNGEHADNPGE